jgi:hypothetical protein
LTSGFFSHINIAYRHIGENIRREKMDQLSDQEKRLLYILEYLDGFHSDKEGAQACANEYCRELVKTTGRRICEGPLPRYPKF